MTSKTKALALALAGIVVLGGGIYLGSSLDKTTRTGAEASSNQARSPEEIAHILSIPKPQAPKEPPSPHASNAQEPINALSQLNDPIQSPKTDIRVLEHLLAQVHTVFHELPTGEHEEIVAFLKGDNPRSIAYIPASDPNVSADGKIIDRWGTPYFFHTLSRHRIEVRSAGPDRLHWSEDDIVSEAQEPSPT